MISVDMTEVGVVGRVSIQTVLINRICTISIVVVWLTIATETAHDGLILTVTQ